MKKFILILLMIFISQVSFGQWQKTNLTYTQDLFTKFSAIAINGINMFVGINGAGVYLSTNNGDNWTQVNNGLASIYVSSIVINNTNIFAGTYGGASLNGGVYRSTNNGITWTQVNNGLISYVYSLGVGGNNIFAGTPGGRIYISTNNGDSWSEAYSGLFSYYYYISSFAESGSNIFAGTVEIIHTGGAFISTNNGMNWSSVGLNNYNIWCFTKYSGNILAGTDHGIYLSSNNGSNWTEAGLDDKGNVSSIVVYGQTIFATTWLGVYRSTNNGSSWMPINYGLGKDSTSISVLAVNDKYLFSGGNGIWRRPLSEMITDIEEEKLPVAFYLSQNFPNPFNPSTTIEYSIPEASFVTIKVYDLLGREVATLVNEVKTPGNYEIKFDAKQSASGIYFYRIKAGEFVETKKLILLR